MSSVSWFAKALAPWYREHHRPLPWRATRDPYRIWLSEVMLQQTRVDQGIGYYHRFLEAFPTVHDLAAASEREVLRLWQGLGYYSRARNLHAAARQVVREHGGRFPADHAALRALPGVGDYTAAAVASIAFGLPEPVVDGNVYRVLARVFGIADSIDGTSGRRTFRELAARLLDPADPGTHNQAVMELGATVCTPKNPDCRHCPLQARCAALATGTVGQLPVKAGKAKSRGRYFNYLHITDGNRIYMRQRTGKDIWQGLYELPLLESPGPLTRRSLKAALDHAFGSGWTIGDEEMEQRHVLSHQVIHAVFWQVEPPPQAALPVEWKRVGRRKLGQLAVPRVIERWMEEGRWG